MQVNGYIVPEDFGLDGPWCPKIHGQEKLGCQEPTFKQLMRMTSGLLPTDNGGCGTPNSTWTPSDWFWDLRQANPLNQNSQPPSAFGMLLEAVLGLNDTP